ncbi:hypothetical protein PMIN01_08058, partial [Paraphaeosphaeria minitans]
SATRKYIYARPQQGKRPRPSHAFCADRFFSPVSLLHVPATYAHLESQLEVFITITVNSGDALSSSLWLASVIGCCFAVATFVIRLRCETTNKTQHVVMVLGDIIATSLICSLMFVPNTNPDWNIHGLIVASSLLSASLTEAYYFLYHAKPVVRDLEPQLHRFWVVLNVILVPAPSLSSLILFSP